MNVKNHQTTIITSALLTLKSIKALNQEQVRNIQSNIYQELNR